MNGFDNCVCVHLQFAHRTEYTKYTQRTHMSTINVYPFRSVAVIRSPIESSTMRTYGDAIIILILAFISVRHENGMKSTTKTATTTMSAQTRPNEQMRQNLSHVPSADRNTQFARNSYPKHFTAVISGRSATQSSPLSFYPFFSFLRFFFLVRSRLAWSILRTNRR